MTYFPKLEKIPTSKGNRKRNINLGAMLQNSD